MGKKDDDNNNGGAPAAPAVNAKADAVLAAMLSGRVKVGRGPKQEHKPLSADQVAKVCAGRLALYRRRVAGYGGQGTPADTLRRVLAMNAADIGLSVPEYKEQFRQVLIDAGVAL